MALGKGKYDDLLTEAREKAGAAAAILIVLDQSAKEGWGFSVQAPPEHLMHISKLLRYIADTIDHDVLAEKDIIENAIRSGT